MQKANTFLADALKTFENEGWSLLKIQTLTDSAKCYEKLNDVEKLVRTCAQIACAKELVTTQQKLHYCKKLMTAAAPQAASASAEEQLGERTFMELFYCCSDEIIQF